MKKLLPLMLIFLFSIQISFAQKTVIRNEIAEIAGGSHPASVVTLENTELEKVEKEFSSYLKKQKGKQDKSDGIIFQDNAIVKDISPDTIDIYAAFRTSGKDVTVILAVNRNGQFINNERGSERGVETLLYEFAVGFRKEQASAALDVAEKALKVIEKNYEKLVDSTNDLKKENEKMKEKISDNESTIKSNQEQISKNKAELNVQKELVKSKESILKSIE